MQMGPARIGSFFAYARERHRITRNRQALMPWPWTEDKVLQENRFCNVFRELDTTTQWFREHIREPLQDDWRAVILGTVVFRWFNRITTGEVLVKHGALLEQCRSGRIDCQWLANTLLKHLPKGPFVTGAFIVKTPDGLSKADGVLSCVMRFQESHLDEVAETIEGPRSLQRTWQALKRSPYLGDFMSYEVVTDLRHTPWLSGAMDIMAWANPGPGCMRGMERLLGAEPGKMNRARESDRDVVLNKMQVLLALSHSTKCWPTAWPTWEMREVEHTLCEFDKYQRVLEGGKMKQRYRWPA